MFSSQHPPAAEPPTPPSVVTSAADILSYIPHALGFMPDESLVVITLANRRLGATLRVDLPPEGTDPLAFAEGVLSFLEGDLEADGTLLVVYTKQSWQRLTIPPRNTLVLNVQAVLGAAALSTRGGWLVSPSGWRDYFCIDEGCCAWPGEPLDSVSYSPLSAELVYGGSAFDTSAVAAVQRVAPAVTPADPADGARETVLRGVEDAQADFAARCADSWCSPAQFRAAAAVWDAVLLRPHEFDAAREPQLVGFLLAGIESRTLRDFLLASACLGTDHAMRGAVACGLLEPAKPPPAAPGFVLDPGSAPLPPRSDREPLGLVRPTDSRDNVVLPDIRTPGTLRERVEAVRTPYVVPGACTVSAHGAEDTAAVSALQAAADAASLDYADLLAGRRTGSVDWVRVDAMSVVLAQLIAVSEGEARAAALTMSGWFEYARGRGSRAAVYLDAAERAVPGYRLARLLQELLRRGGMPAWARRRSTAWTASPALTRDGAA